MRHDEDGRAAWVLGLGLPGQAERAAPRVQGWLRELARDRLAAASDHFAARLGRDYTGLTIRDTRSRWGSCSSQGRLMYSWRLIMAPPEILSYVAAHEVAHLAEMNHSQETLGSLRFASKVAKVDAAAMKPCPKCAANKSSKAGVAKKQAQWA